MHYLEGMYIFYSLRTIKISDFVFLAGPNPRKSSFDGNYRFNNSIE